MTAGNGVNRAARSDLLTLDADAPKPPADRVYFRAGNGTAHAIDTGCASQGAAARGLTPISERDAFLYWWGIASADDLPAAVLADIAGDLPAGAA